MDVEKRLNIGVKSSSELETFLDLKGLDKDSKTLLNDIAFLVKEKLEENTEKDFMTIKYLYYFLQAMDNVPEIKYLLAYMAKVNGFIGADDFAFDEDKQYVFESILFSAFNIYNGGGASKSKVNESRKRFVKKLEEKKEEKLSRTQQLNSIRIQALKELGYTEINNANAQEVAEKMAEIESRMI